jgi:hypothetical protein
VLAPEPLRGLRVVADPAVLDAVVAALPAQSTTFRFASDEALVVGIASLRLDEADAIVEDESGFVAIRVERAVVERHTDWAIPTERGAFAQGAIAGVPAKLAFLPDGQAMVVVYASYADELVERLR